MTDFNSGSFDPTKVGGNYNQQGGKKPSDNGGQPEQAQPPAGDPYADLKVDPSRLMELLSAQAKANLPAELQNPSINSSIAAFSSVVTPERHARATRLVSQAYATEFGKPPSEELLQEMVDNYLIGTPAIAS